MRGGFVAVVVLACALASAAVPCGSWAQTCAEYNNQTSIRGTIEFDGISAGTYTWNRNIFYGPLCSTSRAYLDVSMTGSWLTYDYDDGVEAAQQMFFTAQAVVATPRNASVVAYLNSACPCGGTWLFNTTRTLTSCLQSECLDTTWLGATPLYPQTPGAQGIIIGQAFYGVITAPSWDTTGNLQISYLDAESGVGWFNPNPTLGNMYYGTGCVYPEPAYDACGTWQSPCVPAFPGLPYQSVVTSFTYTGPAPFNGVATNEAGVFSLEETLYSDTGCTTPYITVSQQGTFLYNGNGAILNTNNSYQIERFAPSVSVTPNTEAAAGYLTTQCACGGTWTGGVTRNMTSCLPGACNTETFYHNATFGAINFASFVILNTTNFTELRFTEYASSPLLLPTEFTPSDYGLQLTGACQFNVASDQFCGVWSLPCGAGSDYTYDTINNVMIIGSTQAGSGRFTQERYYYAPGQDCSTSVMSLVADGFWATDGESTVTPGGYNVTINSPSTTVTITDTNMLNYMNKACPCGGTWYLNTPRVITSCRMNTCYVSYFGPGDLGVPGFGTWRTYPNELRISNLSADSETGFSTPLGVSALPYTLWSECPGFTPSMVYCGSYVQPCVTDALTSKDITSTMNLDNSGNFNIQRNVYGAGSGCPSGNNPMFNVSITGKYLLHGASSVIVGGSDISLGSISISVVPITVSGETYLNIGCPCNGTWSVNGVRDITDCEYCPESSWLRLPFANESYGIIERLFDQVRLNTFSENATLGYTQQFIVSDLTYTMATECYHPPAPSPASSSSSKHMAGGSVFLIIVFCLIAAYVILTVAVQYRKTGKLSTPHPEFWARIGSYIIAGFHVTFVECFGFRSRSSGAYSSFDGKESTSYGTL